MTYNAPQSLSASQGGEPVDLDDATVPGKVIHSNASDSGKIAVLRDMFLRNENASTQPIWWTVQGGTLTVPTTRDQMQQAYCPGAGDIEQPSGRPIPHMVVLEQGYSLNISADVSGKAMQITGAVDLYDAAGPSGLEGYGGVISSTTQTIGTITAGNYITVPFQAGSIAVPVNVLQDVANDALAVAVPGVWALTAYVSLEFAKLTSVDRKIYVRFWNKTKEVEVSDAPFPLYVEDGSTGGTWAIPATLTDVPSDLVNDLLELQLGGSTSDFTGVNLDKAGMHLFKIG